MTRRPFNSAPLAVALQAASLLAVAGAVFGILISDIARHRAQVVSFEAPTKVQIFTSPRESDAKAR